MAYEYVSHTADVTIVATGATLAEAFSEAARAVTGVMTDEEVSRVHSHEVSLSAESREALLFDFLSEVIFLLDTEGLFVAGASLNVSEGEDAWMVSGTLFGDDAAKYERSGDVKAPTYHELSVSEEDGAFRVSATLDL